MGEIDNNVSPHRAHQVERMAGDACKGEILPDILIVDRILRPDRKLRQEPGFIAYLEPRGAYSGQDQARLRPCRLSARSADPAPTAAGTIATSVQRFSQV